jgi:hypothetical protein
MYKRGDNLERIQALAAGVLLRFIPNETDTFGSIGLFGRLGVCFECS